MLRAVGMVLVLGLVVCGGDAHSSRASADLQCSDCGASDAGPGPLKCDLACEIGVSRCDGPLLEICSGTEDGCAQWTTLEVCATPALCVDDNSGVSGCTLPECSAGETRCKGAERQRCTTDRTGFELIETCASAAQCAPERCM